MSLILLLFALAGNALLLRISTDLSGALPPWAAILVQPLIVTLLLGAFFRNLLPTIASVEKMAITLVNDCLPFGLVLLGSEFELRELVGLGGRPLLGISLTIVLTLILGRWLAGVSHLTQRTTWLLLIGNCICGPSAITFVSTVLICTPQEVALAIFINSLTGFLFMALLPVLGSTLHLEPASFGLWAGSSLQSTAQVVASASMYSPEAVDIAVLIKSIRILMLVPLMIALSWAIKRKSTSTDQRSGFWPGLPIPGFMLGFILVALMFNAAEWLITTTQLPGLALTTLLPEFIVLQKWVSNLSALLICSAMFAIGYQLKPKRIGPTAYPMVTFSLYTAFILVVISYWLVVT